MSGVQPIQRMRGCAWQTGGRVPSVLPTPTTTAGETRPTKILSYKIPDALFPPGETPTLSAVITIILAETLPDGTTKQVDDPQFDWSDAFIRITGGTGDDADDEIIEIDPINGTCVPLAMRSGMFQLIYPTVEKQGMKQPALDVSVSIAFGVVSTGERPPRRTIKVPDFAQAVESKILPIPKYAHGAVLQNTDIATAAMTFKQYSAPLAGAILKSQVSLGKLEYQSAVPIVNGARGFSITSAGAITDVAVIFYLCTG